MVPNGWTKTTFDSLIDILVGFSFKSDQYTENSTDILLLRGDNIEPGALRWKNAKRWPCDKIQNLQKYQLIKGDFVIAMDRTWITSGLKVAEVTEKDLPCLLVQRVARIRTNSKLEQNLLTHYFSSYQFEQYVKSVQLATAVPHISSNNIKNFPILLPPIEEQQKIAEILSTWDKAIASTEKLIANSEQQKKALMQQLLTGKKRLLDENGVRFSGEWKKTTLSKIADVYQPKTISQTHLTTRGYPVYGANGIIGFYHEFNHETKQIAITCRGSTCGTVNLTQENSWITGNAMVVNTDSFNIVDKKFLYYLLDDTNFSYLISGSGQPQITGNIKNHIIYIPIKNEQEKIAEVLSNADREIELLKAKLEHLQQEKKALMQQLLTGKRRVVIN